MSKYTNNEKGKAKQHITKNIKDLSEGTSEDTTEDTSEDTTEGTSEESVEEYKDQREYDPKKDTRMYHVYRNDIRYGKIRNIDPKRAIWTDDVKHDYYNKNVDAIDYRIEECRKEKYELLDLSHMDSDCFDLLFSHGKFNTIRNRVQHLFAEDCGLNELPDLNMFRSLLTLNVSKNKLKYLGKLPETLEELVVNNNKLTSVLNVMPNLVRFIGSNNNIQQFRFPISIERLHLDRNPFNIPIPTLNKLYHLDIAETNVSSVASNPSLKYIDVSKNMNIKVLPSFPLLDHLCCNYSSLELVGDLPVIRIIELINSKILFVPYFKTLQSLVYSENQPLRLNKNYTIKRVRKNTNNINEIIFDSV